MFAACQAGNTSSKVGPKSVIADNVIHRGSQYRQDFSQPSRDLAIPGNVNPLTTLCEDVCDRFSPGDTAF